MSRDPSSEHNRDVFDAPDVVDTYRVGPSGLTAAESHLVRRHLHPDGALLDLGVGAGRTTAPLQKLSRRYVGVDYAPAMVAAARAAHPGTDLRVGDAADLSDFADGEFDAVFFSFNGIDYLHPDEARHRVLREVRRVLRDGGTWIFSTHNPRDVVKTVRPGSGRPVHNLGAGLYMTARRAALTLPTPAFWRGEGYVPDRTRGLVTHVATPARVVEETRRFGFRHVETVAGDLPRRPSRWRSPWYYYAFVAS